MKELSSLCKSQVEIKINLTRRTTKEILVVFLKKKKNQKQSKRERVRERSFTEFGKSKHPEWIPNGYCSDRAVKKKKIDILVFS